MDPLTNEGARGVVRRLEEALARLAPGATPLLALDADGTLWTGDVGVDLFLALVRSGDVRPEAEAALAAEAASIGLSRGATPVATAQALFEAFVAERYAEDRAFAMMAWVFAGWTSSQVSAFAMSVAAEAGLAARIRPAVAEILAFARDRGVEAVLVSASPRAIVEVGAGSAGIAPGSVLAMTPAIEGGRVAPRLEGIATYAEGKVRALHAARPGAVLVGAMGDGAWDAEMLREAMVPVMVHPSARLVAKAASLPGVVRLEE
jgi:phosphoserine phosphatase